MFGGNCGFGGQPCTIILIIIIFRYLCLLDTDCNPSARNAITLLLLWWLCSGGCGIGNFGSRNNGSCCGRSCC